MLCGFARHIRELFVGRNIFLAALLVIGVVIGAKLWGTGPIEENRYRRVQFSVADGDTYGTLMERAGISADLAAAIYQAAKTSYDLSTISSGWAIELTLATETDELAKFVYVIDDERFLSVEKEFENGWRAAVEAFPYETRLEVVRGTVETSMYEAGVRAGIDTRTIVALAEAFQWTLDFGMDPRQGDTFAALYSKIEEFRRLLNSSAT